MSMVLADLNLMNTISYLLCIDSRLDIGKDSTKLFLFSVHHGRNEDNFKEMRKYAIFLRYTNTYINNNISFVVGLS